MIVFCLLSGWLISRKKPRSLKSLFKTIINRYLRFAVPLLFVNSLIYCVGKTIGFSATECGSLMGNNWFASQYLLDLHFRDVIFSAILLDKTLNSTFWVIRHMFVASALIYCANYISQKVERNLQGLGIVATGLLILYPSTFFIGTCCVGACFDGILEKVTDKRMETHLKTLSVIAVIMLCGGQSTIASRIGFFRMNPFYEMLYSVVILLIISLSKGLQRNLERPVMNMIESNVSSFSMYILHWPLICALSARIMIYGVRMANSFGIVFLTNFVLSSMILVALVLGYGKTVEKLGDRILKIVAR